MLIGARRFISPAAENRLWVLYTFFLSKDRHDNPKYFHYDSLNKDDVWQVDCLSILFSEYSF